MQFHRTKVYYFRSNSKHCHYDNHRFAVSTLCHTYIIMCMCNGGMLKLYLNNYTVYCIHVHNYDLLLYIYP